MNTHLLAILPVACFAVHALADTLASRPAPAKGPWRVYVGSYTAGGKSKGISRFDFDPGSGKLTPAGLAAESANPSFLALHPNGRFVYAVGEIEQFEGRQAGAVHAFKIAADGGLALLNSRPSGGQGPCHLAVSPDGRSLLVANYSSGSTGRLAIAADGRLEEQVTSAQHVGSGPNAKRQAGPHAHCAAFAPDANTGYVADLGADRIFSYSLQRPGMLEPGQAIPASTPGAGPRQIAIHPGGRLLFAVNELDSTMAAYAREGGGWKPTCAVSSLPAGWTGDNTGSGLALHPSGQFLYGSNRGHDSVAIFSVDLHVGTLTLVGHEPTGGKTPRHIALDSSGTWLIAANQNSDALTVFRIDPKTGRLSPVGTPVPSPMPVCVLFAPSGNSERD